MALLCGRKWRREDAGWNEGGLLTNPVDVSEGEQLPDLTTMWHDSRVGRDLYTHRETQRMNEIAQTGGQSQPPLLRFSFTTLETATPDGCLLKSEPVASNSNAQQAKILGQTERHNINI